MNSVYDPCPCSSGKKFKFCCYKTVKAQKCGLCSASKKLTRTECCNNLICDDEDKYVLFSYEANSCNRNHRRGTICGIHHIDGHDGKWQDCQKCKDNYSVEMYVYFGMSGYNFETLANPPSYPPIHCQKCSKIIRLGFDDCDLSNEGYFCDKCPPFGDNYQAKSLKIDSKRF